MKLRAPKVHGQFIKAGLYSFLAFVFVGVFMNAIPTFLLLGTAILWGATFFGEFPVNKLLELLGLSEKVSQVEEKQDDMADVLGLNWNVIPEQRFYDKKGKGMEKYMAKKNRKLSPAFK